MADTNDLEPLLNTQQNDLALSISDANSVDAKSLAMLATNVAILLFIGQAEIGPAAWWQYLSTLGPFFASLALDAWAIWPRRYQTASVSLQDHPEYLSLAKTQLVLQLLTDTEAAVTTNNKVNASRLKLFLVSLLLTACGSTALFVILIV